MFQRLSRNQISILLTQPAVLALVLLYSAEGSAVALNPRGSYEDAKVESIAFVQKIVPHLASMKFRTSNSLPRAAEMPKVESAPAATSGRGPAT